LENRSIFDEAITRTWWRIFCWSTLYNVMHRSRTYSCW